MAELFEKFGEFDSVEELNRAAAGQLEQGDIEALKLLAKENGIEDDDVEDYIDGCVDELATPMTAALGRIEVEMKEIKDERERMPCMVIANMTKALCSDLLIAKAVMKKGKRIQKISRLMYENRCFSGTDRELSEIIIAYYFEGEESVKDEINQIKNRYKGE